MMKLGSGTGSLINHVISQGSSVTPEVGMGCTILHWTDRSPGTIISIHGTTKIVVQEDTAIRTDKNGMSESQEYEYSRNINGILYTFRKRKDGSWKNKAGEQLALGYREKYYDFSF